MSEADKKRLIADMRAYSKKIAKSDADAKKLLVKTGMYTRNGKLKPQFR